MAQQIMDLYKNGNKIGFTDNIFISFNAKATGDYPYAIIDVDKSFDFFLEALSVDDYALGSQYVSGEKTLTVGGDWTFLFYITITSSHLQMIDGLSDQPQFDDLEPRVTVYPGSGTIKYVGSDDGNNPAGSWKTCTSIPEVQLDMVHSMDDDDETYTVFGKYHDAFSDPYGMPWLSGSQYSFNFNDWPMGQDTTEYWATEAFEPVSESKSEVSIIIHKFYAAQSGGDLSLTYYKEVDGAPDEELFSFETTIPPNSYDYWKVWVWCGKFPWEMNEPGSYYVRTESPWYDDTIHFKLTDGNGFSFFNLFDTGLYKGFLPTSGSCGGGSGSDGGYQTPSYSDLTFSIS